MEVAEWIKFNWLVGMIKRHSSVEKKNNLWEAVKKIHKLCSDLIHHHLVESSLAWQGVTPEHEKSLLSLQTWDTKNPHNFNRAHTCRSAASFIGVVKQIPPHQCFPSHCHFSQQISAIYQGDK